MIIVMKSILFTRVKKEQYILRLFFFEKYFTSENFKLHTTRIHAHTHAHRRQLRKSSDRHNTNF